MPKLGPWTRILPRESTVPQLQRSQTNNIATGMGYKRRFGLFTHSNTVPADFYMSSPQPPKRKEPSLQDDKTTSKPKRQKCRHPPVFYDRLSKIFLTTDALRELNWRNDSFIPRPPHRNQLTGRPVTRAVTRLAMEGGPDITDLRGVCNAK